MNHHPAYHNAEEVVADATRWLLARYAQSPSRHLASLIARHLAWLETRPHLAQMRAGLTETWRRLRVDTAAASALH